MQATASVMDADRDAPDDYDRSGRILLASSSAATSAPKQEAEASRAPSSAPGKPAVKGRRDTAGAQASFVGSLKQERRGQSQISDRQCREQGALIGARQPCSHGQARYSRGPGKHQ